MNGLLINLEDAGFPARSDTFDLLYVKIMTAADPLQAGLQKPCRHETVRMFALTTPTDRATIDVVKIVVFVAFDVRYLIAELAKDPGHRRQTDLDLCAYWQDFEG